MDTSPKAERKPNWKFIRARKRLESLRDPGAVMSREEFADECNKWLASRSIRDQTITANTIAKIEQGKTTWPGLWRRRAYRAVTGAATDAELGLYDRRRSPLEKPHTPSADPYDTLGLSHSDARDEALPTGDASVTGAEAEMRRRILLQQVLTALSGGVVGWWPALDTVRLGLPTADGASDTDVWAETAEEYGSAYYTHRPTDLVANLSVDLTELQDALTTTSARGDARTHQELSRVCGQLCAVMAMSLTNLGQPLPARRWWRAAETAADTSGDTSTQVWVRAQSAIHALYGRRTVGTALRRAEHVISISGKTVSPGTAEAAAARAQALAMLGRADDAKAAVTSLAQTFEQLPDTLTNDDGIMWSWPQRRLWHSASFVYTYLGDTRQAYRAQEQALALTPAAAPRARAQVQLHHAVCLVHDGNIDDGANHATSVIQQLPAQQRTALVLDLGRHLLDVTPTDTRSRSSLRDLDELITTSTTTAAA